MSFTELFIRRPVLSMVVSLLILLLGAQGLMNLQVRQYPEVEETTITITTTYTGASADLIQGFISTPIAKSVSSAEGVDYVTTQSRLGVSTVSVRMRLNTDPNAALTEVTAKVQQVRAQLPSEAEDPVIMKGTGQSFALMYITFGSTEMNPEQVSEFLTRVVQPRFATLEGVGNAEILGGRDFSMRVWLDPVRLAARGVTAGDVVAGDQCQQLPRSARQDAERIRGLQRSTCRPRCRRRRPSACCRSGPSGDQLVRLRDVADVELGPESTDTIVSFNGKPGHLHRHHADAVRQSADRRRRGHEGDRCDPSDSAQGHERGDRLRRVELHLGFHRGGVQDHRRSGAHRRGRDPAVPGLLPLGADPHRDDPALARRRVLLPLCARLLDQPPDPAGDGARHRSRGRRRHRGAGEHPPSHRGGFEARRCGHRGHEGDLPSDRLHDHHARGRLCADRLHDGLDRLALPGVRLHARRRGDHLRYRRDHALADDVVEAAEASWRSRPVRRLRGPHLHAARELVWAAPQGFAGLPRRDARHRRRSPRHHGVPVHQDVLRACAGRGSGRLSRHPQHAEIRDRRLHAALLQAVHQCGREDPRDRRQLPDRRHRRRRRRLLRLQAEGVERAREEGRRDQAGDPEPPERECRRAGLRLRAAVSARWRRRPADPVRAAHHRRFVPGL